MERRAKIDAARTCTSRSCARSPSSRRRARLDRAARQPRPVSVPRADRRLARAAGRRAGRDARDVLRAAPDRRREPPAWLLEFARRRRHRGLRARSTCAPTSAVAWYWTYSSACPTSTASSSCATTRCRRPRQGLEIRADGLWAELMCETPGEHWTFGLEAFGVRLDDARRALRRAARSASASRSASTSNGKRRRARARRRARRPRTLDVEGWGRFVEAPPPGRRRRGRRIASRQCSSRFPMACPRARSCEPQRDCAGRRRRRLTPDDRARRRDLTQRPKRARR